MTNAGRCVVSDGYLFVHKWAGKEKEEHVALAAPKAQLNLLLCSAKRDDAKVR